MQSIRLIVNADDYGYYPCISRGILKAAATGAVNATGIIAAAPKLPEQAEWLVGHESLDVGVHLNLTSGKPLTCEMAVKLPGGNFQGVFAMAARILSGRITSGAITAEWRAQIERILSLGLKPLFLNSHEHIHMLPGLFPLALDLAHEYRIPQVRLTRPEWTPPYGVSACLRNLLMQSMEMANKPRANNATPIFLGWGRSGKLDLPYLENLFGKLRVGGIYELMCHPGHFDPAEITDRRLLSYHAWESELALLTSPEIKALYDKFGIQTASYRDLTDSL